MPPIPPEHGQQVDYSQPAPYGQPAYKPSSANGSYLPLDIPLPPIRPVFGVSLGDLFDRDLTMVPLIVDKCIAAVETFALNMEGLYRVNGSTTNIARLKMLFDHGKRLNKLLLISLIGLPRLITIFCFFFLFLLYEQTPPELIS